MAITEQQRLERIGYLGSSDAPAVLGLSKWSSPLKVWALKTGLLQPEDLSNKFQIRHGNKMEPVIAQMYMEETGEKVHRVLQTLRHPKYPFIAANLDYRVVGKRKGLECKATSSYRSKDWEGGEEDLPAEVVVQCLHQMAVTGYEEWDAAAVIGNSHIAIKTIRRDERAIENLVKAEVRFWNEFVVPKIRPDHVTAYDKETLDELYPAGKESDPIILPDEAAALAESLGALMADKDDVEKRIEVVKNHLRGMLGEHQVGLTSGHRVAWKNYNVRRVALDPLREAHPDICAEFTRETTERRFTVKALKKETHNG